MAIILHGIKNCDTIKKARSWLESHCIEYQFHDFRVDGIDKNMVKGWLKQLEWESLLNTRGTTWRKLPETQREGINKANAIALMLKQPAVIKRPVLSINNHYYLGFKEEEYENLFKKNK